MDNRSKDIADEYMRLGGQRRAVMDDNLVSTRSWENDTPEAAKFWKDRVEPLERHHRDEIVSFLPTINAI